MRKTSTIKSMRTQLDAQAEEIRILKAALFTKERGVETKAPSKMKESS